MSDSRIKELSEKYLQLRTKKAALEQEAKDVGGEMDQIELELIPMMEELDAQNLKIEGVGTVYLQTSFYVRGVPEKKAELVEWLDSQGMGDLAPRSIHTQTLQSEYRKWADDDKPLPPPELVSAFPKTEVRVRKAS